MNYEKLEKEVLDYLNTQTLPKIDSLVYRVVKNLIFGFAEPKEKRITELELKIKLITKHLEPQAMTALFEQVEEDIKQEQRIAEFEAQIEKMKADVELARDNANKTENWETFSILNSIIDDWEIKEK